MLKKTINYLDYEGNERSEDHYFNISEAELVKLEASESGGFSNYIQKIIDAKDNKVLMTAFEQIVKLSYGIKSDDGRRFIKNEDVWNEFTQTGAYNSLFLELTTDAGASADFINNVIPNRTSIENIVNKGSRTQLDSQVPTEPWILENRDPTKDEVRGMTKKQLAEAMKAKQFRESFDKEDEEAEMLRKQLLGE